MTTVTSAAVPLALFGIDWLNPVFLIQQMGTFALVGLCLIVFAECGAFAFFLPGDSLLFIAGFFAATGAFGVPVWVVALLLTISGILGNAVGYWIGWKAGPALFNRPNSKIFKQEYLEKTHEFFERYGARAIILARFVPVVRTFITAVAGIGRMDAKKYFTYSVIGGIAWAAGLTFLGAALGDVPLIKNNIEAALILIVFLSILPIIFEFVRERRKKRKQGPVDLGEQHTQVIPKI
ncbi:VTT domain-containing protein [Crossiella cryophila]|uniref:Membrane-associated protein n=2 Tax=Crossiella cryophila TaxID=43355 RepID=A0A7W7C5B6_9PSEU|nr:VTT domain-containing protein [Crossiella cryophila]MBB4674817.1 membrane-associated protein [Crossiella cryophila]